jgi:UDP-N-acetylglucosamine 2-epimerase
MKILTIIGARPQFIKAAPVSRALEMQGYREVIVHTGQHYDHNMSGIFFEELQIRRPDHNLGVGSGSHGVQTGQMLIRIEETLLTEQPDLVLVYGDTNSTLAGALAAAKLHIPVAHVEAGLRSFNRLMPEEHNRVLTDHLADLLFCPTQTAVHNLAVEGVSKGVFNVGDVMYDALLFNLTLAEEKVDPLGDLHITPRNYYLVTVHRPYNTDKPKNLSRILGALGKLQHPVIFPVHPRTRKSIQRFNLTPAPNVHLIEPVGYMEMLILEKNANTILTDSGGVQKEAFLFGVLCVTIRPETEWLETVSTGWNTLVSPTEDSILKAVSKPGPTQTQPLVFGNGHAAQRIAEIITSELRCDHFGRNSRKSALLEMETGL